MKVRLKWTPGTTFQSPADGGLFHQSDPIGLMDIHSHILWDLDDGAQNPEQSFVMLNMAAANGTTDIVATPHANREYIYRPELIAERVAELRESFPELPRIHTGCDFHLNVANINDGPKNPHKYTINGLNYLLVDFT